jgi:carbonic anhydrase
MASVLAGAGMGAASAARASEVAPHKVEALLLCCMDYRLIDDTQRWMAGRGLEDRYDQLILAGASIAVTSGKYPAWAETFWGELDIAVKLHGVGRVIVLDHRDCGAYRLILGKDLKDEPQKELAAHVKELYGVRELILNRHPGMQVELALMSLDGTVMPVA